MRNNCGIVTFREHELMECAITVAQLSHFAFVCTGVSADGGYLTHQDAYHVHPYFQLGHNYDYHIVIPLLQAFVRASWQHEVNSVSCISGSTASFV